MTYIVVLYTYTYIFTYTKSHRRYKYMRRISQCNVYILLLYSAVINTCRHREITTNGGKKYIGKYYSVALG